jgi:uncharacterized membrane protein YfcA
MRDTLYSFDSFLSPIGHRQTPPMTSMLLVFATLATSLISGVLSMAGGMILMGVFSLFLTVPTAMVLHGIAQAFSNGSRIWLHRRHIRWAVLLPYTLGSFVILGLFMLITFIPNKGLVFLLIGLFPFIAFVIPKSLDLDIERPVMAFLCGLLVTTAQMLAGASGPVLDIFYVQSKLSRYEILGTKAITQTLGHLIKLVYYGLLLSVSVTAELPAWLIPAVIIAALFGNWLGKHIVDRLDDAAFKKIGKIVILLIGIAYIGKAMDEWHLLDF